MISSPDSQPAAPEALVIPPEKPIFSIPLQGAVELCLPTDQETLFVPNPKERVEAFLESNGTIIVAVNEAWGYVKASQERYKSTTSDFLSGGINKMQSRDSRRNTARFAKDFTNPNVAFGTIKHQASLRYPKLLKKLDHPVSLEGHNHQVVQELDALFRSEETAYEKIYEEERKNVPETVKTFLRQMTENTSALLIANIYALFRQDIALRKVQAFLQDPAVVPAFVDRLKTLAATNEQLREYPGLLELMATHIAQEGDKNMLQSAMKKSAPKDTVYANEVWQGLREKPKELATTMKAMELAAAIVADNTSFSQQEFMDLYAARAAEWPPELLVHLQVYAHTKSAERWNEIEAILARFVRNSRLPAVVSKRALDLSDKRKHQRPKNDIPQSDADRSDPKLVLQLGSRVQIHEDLIGNTEKEPISAFATLRAKGDKAKLRYFIETADNLEELVILTNVDDYLNAHANEPGLRTTVEAALQRLTVSPTDPSCTRLHRDINYTIESEDGHPAIERHPRSLQTHLLPGVRKDSLTAKTWILYDVLNYKGQPTLIVYGAVNREQIKDLNKLPPLPKR